MTLSEQAFAPARRDDIDAAKATPSKELKRPAVFSQLQQYADSHPRPAAPPEGNHTTHYSVVDAEGNAVAVTTTINDWFGSRVTADGLACWSSSSGRTPAKSWTTSDGAIGRRR